MISNSNSKTVGVLWEITDKCLDSLDSLEGFPSYYDRKILPIVYKNQKYDAWVYFMQPGNTDGPPCQQYWDCLIEGYSEHNVNRKQLYSALEQSMSDHDYNYE